MPRRLLLSNLQPLMESLFRWVKKADDEASQTTPPDVTETPEDAPALAPGGFVSGVTPAPAPSTGGFGAAAGGFGGFSARPAATINLLSTM